MRRNAVLIIALAVLAAVLSATNISDYDFWWHLKRGELSWSLWDITGADTFSYTYAGKPQFNGEWLADLLIFISFKAGGLYGVNALKCGVLIAAFLFLYKTLKSMAGDDEGGTWLYSSVITLALVLFSIRFRLYVRPFLFSYLFVSIFLYVIARYVKTGNARLLYILPFAEAAWANLSKGAFYGPVILLLFAAGEFMARRHSKDLIIALIGVFLLSMLSPETYSIYVMPFKLTAVDKDFFVGEHQPLSRELLWGHGAKYTAPYQALVAGALLYFVFFRGWKSFYHLALFLVFLIPSIQMIRMIDFFSIIAAVMFVRPVDGLMRIILRPVIDKKAALNAVFAALIVAAAVISASASKTYAFGAGVKADTFPEEALSFLDREGVKGRLFNSYPFGGYIIWRSPERKVFIDGRGIHYLYTTGFFSYYRDIVKNAASWRKAEAEWGFDYALLEYDIKGDQSGFPTHLNTNHDWALVYWDNHSAVYLKRTEANRRAIEAYEYKIAKPAFYDFSYLDFYLDGARAASAAEALSSDIAKNPLNQEPRLAKAFLLYNMRSPGFKDEALKELRASMDLKPDIAIEHSAAAIILYEKGRLDEARAEMDKALKKDPADKAANYLKTKLEGRR